MALPYPASKLIQTNLGTDPSMYKNLMQAWGSIQSSNPLWPTFVKQDMLPADGTIGGASSIFGTIVWDPVLVNSSVTMVFAWTGTISPGAISFSKGAPGFTVSAGASFVSGSTDFNMSFQGTNGYVEFTINGSTVGLTLNYNPGGVFSGVNSIIFCRKSDYNSIVNATDPAQMFTDEWIAKLTPLNLGQIRTLGLQDVNNNPAMTQHRYRKNWKTGVALSAAAWLPTAWSGTSTGSGASYVLAANTDTPAVYTRGEVVQCAFGTGSFTAITALGAITAGTGYTNGTYNGVALTGGEGAGATANITVSGGVVTACTLVSGGTSGYRVGNVLSAAAASIGGTGSGFSIPVTATSAALAVNVGARGAVPLYDMAARALLTVTTTQPYMMIYDDLLGGYLVSNHGHGSSFGNMPLELIVALANRLNAGLWYVMPPHMTLTNSAMEGGSNSVAQVTSYIAANLISTDRVVELGNEIWNYTGAFWWQTTYFQNCGTLVGMSSDNNRHYYGFHSFRVNQMADAVAAAAPSVKVALAFQAFAPTAAVSSYRMQSADLASVANGGQGNATWVSYTSNANFRSSPNRTIDKVDIIAYAHYYSGHNCANFDQNWSVAKFNNVKVWADLYATGTAANIDSALQSLDADVAGPASDQTTEDLNTSVYPGWETTAASFDSGRPTGKVALEIRAYEGAFESVAPSTGWCTSNSVSTTYGGTGGLIDNLLVGYKRSRYFYMRVLKQYKQMIAASPTRKVVPCWYLIGNPSQWSMYNGSIFSTTPFQSYDVVKNVNAGRRRFYTN